MQGLVLLELIHSLLDCKLSLNWFLTSISVLFCTYLFQGYI